MENKIMIINGTVFFVHGISGRMEILMTFKNKTL